MNMIKNLFSGFLTNVMNFFANWLSFDFKYWVWCPVRVDSRFDRF